MANYYILDTENCGPNMETDGPYFLRRLQNHTNTLKNRRGMFLSGVYLMICQFDVLEAGDLRQISSSIAPCAAQDELHRSTGFSSIGLAHNKV